MGITTEDTKRGSTPKSDGRILGCVSGSVNQHGFGGLRRKETRLTHRGKLRIGYFLVWRCTKSIRAGLALFPDRDLDRDYHSTNGFRQRRRSKF